MHEMDRLTSAEKHDEAHRHLGERSQEDVHLAPSIATALWCVLIYLVQTDGVST
jgi:hypothetical protein